MHAQLLMTQTFGGNVYLFSNGFLISIIFICVKAIVMLTNTSVYQADASTYMYISFYAPSLRYVYTCIIHVSKRL